MTTIELTGERDIYLTDGGLETVLVFQEDIDLPHFAACELYRSADGTDTLERYYRRHAGLARELGTGLVLDTATWRANPDWAERLGYDAAELERVNRAAVALARRIRDDFLDVPVLVDGMVGPRGDGYIAGDQQTAEEAERYHGTQIRLFAEEGVDFVSALTLSYPEEAIGIALAARDAAVPVVLSFTVETDGRLPNGSSLREAIETVDRATDSYPSFYMVNCAHPTHLPEELLSGETWTRRVGGLRSNASRMSHAELDAAEELDAGDPVDLGARYATLRKRMPWLRVLGGCCGTDIGHVREIAVATAR